MTFASRALSTVALSGTTILACGARTGLDVDPGPRVGELAGDAANEAEEARDAADALDTADSADAPDTCEGRQIALQLNAPNLYFALDHSGSMQLDSKWTNVRQVVSQLITQIGAGARFGATMFPGVSEADSCVAGVEVMPLQQGDAQGTLANAFLAATAANPNGGTPTAATLGMLMPKLSGLSGGTFVILATDGGPNCNSGLACNVAQCTSNIDGVPGCVGGGAVNCCDPPAVNGLGCLDEANAVKATSNLAAAGVQTFVMGIPGSAPYGPVLDAIATAGGTARPVEPLYYQVGTSDVAALSGALAQIAARTGAGCAFTLATLPAHADQAQVSVNGAPVARSGPDGWSLNGKALTLSGASCTAVRAAGAPSAQLVDGCGG
jgi:hypothetical protein